METIKEKVQMHEERGKYMLLNRLQSDCEAWESFGCKLWGGDKETHAAAMVELYNQLKLKPEWLPLAELKSWCFKLTRRELQRCNSCMDIFCESLSDCPNCGRDDCLMFPFE